MVNEFLDYKLTAVGRKRLEMSHNDRLQVKLMPTRLPDNAAGMLPQLIKPQSGAKTHVDPLKGCVPCDGNNRLKPVTPGHQDEALTEVKTTNPVKALQCTGSLTGGGSQKVQTES